MLPARMQVTECIPFPFTTAQSESRLIRVKDFATVAI
jgi:hypothetical protein